MADRLRRSPTVCVGRRFPFEFALFLLWAALLLGPAALHPGWALMPPRSPFSDLLISHWPNAEFLRRSLFQFHQLPLWNPSILGGAPFAADPLAGLWYPPNWLTVILPLPFAFNILLMLHLAWGGWGMARWARASGVGQGPALLAGLAFAGMPKLIAHIGAGHISLVYAVAWTPWLMLSVERATAIAKAHSVFILHPSSFILALIALADPRWAVYAGAAMIALWLGRRASLRTLLHSLALAALLTAILWLPLLEFVSRASRAALTAADNAAFALPPGYLIGLIVPNLGGFHEWMTYLGLAPLALAIIGVAKGRDRVGVRLMVAMALVSLLWALGTGGGLFALLGHLPGISLLRVPSRSWFLVGLAACWLAGQGAQAVAEGFRLAGRAANLATVGVVAALWLLAVGGSTAARHPLINLLGMAAIGTAVLLALRGDVIPSRTAARNLSAGPEMLRASSPQHDMGSVSPGSGARLTRPLAALLALTLLDLLWVNSTLLTARPVEPSVVAQWLNSQPGVWRVYSPSFSVPPLDTARLGLEQADGVNPLQLSDTVAFMTRATGVASGGYSVTVPPFLGDVATANAAAVPDAGLLGELNVRFVVSEFDLRGGGFILRMQIGRTRIYENIRDRGRVSAGALTSWSPNRIEYLVSAEGDGRAILSEVWYPGWRAWVDGKPATIEHAGLFRAVTAGAGAHRVVFEFWPLSVYVGAALSMIGLGLALWSAQAIRTRKNADER
ncbi:MAG: hypothetical protein HY679_11540 [Chloroflexi bacterium]|nr:hypothetical protein [Chloroflexota bacterium]